MSNPSATSFNIGDYKNLTYQGVIDLVYSKLTIYDPEGNSNLWTEFNDVKDKVFLFYTPWPTPSWEAGATYREAVINKAIEIINITDSKTTDITKSATKPPVSSSGKTFNTQDTTSSQKVKDDLQEKIVTFQKLGLPPISKIPDEIWKMIELKLLTPRQIAKKILIIQGRSFNPPLSEEDAQLAIYGKVYYKNGKLYDNDLKDTVCVSQPDDVDYEPSMDENHPMWQKIIAQEKELKFNLTQLGIKLGEFTFALPNAIAVIAVSLVALVSSAIILPFGAGLPTALSAVLTMITAIKQLQSKTAEILPLLVVLDLIALLLPSDAQAIIAQITAVFAIFLGIIAALSIVLGLLDKILSKFSKAKAKMESIPLKIAPKAEPSNVSKGETVNLTANATGSDWNFTFEWTDIDGNIISRDPDSTDDDDGSRTIIPIIPVYHNVGLTRIYSTTYTCKVTDGKGVIEQKTVTVTRA